MARNLDPTTRLEELDNSLGVRNRAEAIKHYKALLVRAIGEWDIEEAIELQNSLVEIYQTDAAYTEDLRVLLQERKQLETFYDMLKLCASEAGVGEVPDMNRLQLEDIKRLDVMGAEHGFFPSNLETLYQSAQRRGVGITVKSRVERPKKHFRELLNDWRQQAATSEGKETLRSLGAQFGSLFQEHVKALKEGDLETTIRKWDRAIDIDQPKVLSGIPFLNVPEYKQMLISSRDFTKRVSTIGAAVDEGHTTDAVHMAKALLQEYHDGVFPGLQEHLLIKLRCSVCNLSWRQSYKAWMDAFHANEFTKALAEIKSLRELESSAFFEDPVVENFCKFSANDFTDWNQLRTLHRHFHEIGRPNLALKTVTYLLRRYELMDHTLTPPSLSTDNLDTDQTVNYVLCKNEPLEHAPTLPSLSNDNLDRERAFKWTYEALQQRKQFLQRIAEQDFGAALLLVNAIAEEAKNAPKGLKEFVPQNLLCQLDDEQKKILQSVLGIMKEPQTRQS